MISRDINNIDYKLFLDDHSIVKSIIYKYHPILIIIIKKKNMKIRIHDSQMR